MILVLWLCHTAQAHDGASRRSESANGLYRQLGFFHTGSSPLTAQIPARRPASAGAATSLRPLQMDSCCSSPIRSPGACSPLAQVRQPAVDSRLRRRPASAGGRATTDTFRRSLPPEGTSKFAYVRYAASVAQRRCKSGGTKCKLPWQQEEQVIFEEEADICSGSGASRVCLPRGMHLAEHASNLVLQTRVAGFTVRGKGAKSTAARRNVLLERVHPPGAFPARHRDAHFLRHTLSAHGNVSGTLIPCCSSLISRSGTEEQSAA